MIYLDHAATSWPKPESVYLAMDSFIREKGGNPGRGAHYLARESVKVIEETRHLLALLFNAEDKKNIVFTANVTAALNLALKGTLKQGDHVLISGMEHNAVARPLYALQKQGVELEIVPCSVGGLIDPDEMESLFRSNTRMVCVLHASNVCGSIMPVQEVAKRARKRGILVLVDAAQTAGAYAIDVQTMGIDFLAFTGHKGLLGPPGTGGLYMAPGIEVEPLVFGGTGSKSYLEEQPHILPERFESGTLNSLGLAGLGAGIKYITAYGLDKIRRYEEGLTAKFLQNLVKIPGIKVYGTRDSARHAPVVSFNLEGWNTEEAAFYLESVHSIATRAGLHCAPLAHKVLGTYPHGTVRVSFGIFNTEEEVQQLLDALVEMSKES